jgi:hypothetical protein
MEETIQYILKKLIKPRLEQLKETTISGIDTMEKISIYCRSIQIVK